MKFINYRITIEYVDGDTDIRWQCLPVSEHPVLKFEFLPKNPETITVDRHEGKDKFVTVHVIHINGRCDNG